MSIAQRILKMLLWKGLLDVSGRRKRVMTIVTSAVAAFSLTFTQIGFVSNGLDEPFASYIIMLLMPVAASSLLLGTVWGTMLGFFAGALLYVHALFMPLDFHELIFVTPGTSMLMLSASGFALGMMFCVGLGRAQTRLRRLACIALPCTITSFAYTFLSNAISTSSMARSIASQISLSLTREQFLEKFNCEIDLMSSRLGSMHVQAITDALLMVALCCLLDYVTRRFERHSAEIGLRTLFCAWLIDIVSIVFMLSTAVCFLGSTAYEFSTRAQSSRSEIAYIFGQINAVADRNEKLLNLFRAKRWDLEKLTKAEGTEFDDLINPLGNILSGYTLAETGYVAIIQDGRIIMSNDGFLPTNSPIEGVLETDGMRALNSSVQTGEVERTLFDSPMLEGESGWTPGNTQIAFLLAEEHDGITVMILQTSDKTFAGRATAMTGVNIVTSLMFVAVIALVTYLLSTVVGTRIDDIDHTLGLITQGDLDARANVSGTREFKSLTSGINYTVDVLKGWIAEAETRMDSELAAAREIQESALPTNFPAFPNIHRFGLYASMHPAKQVGGDFYDFFLLDGATQDAGRLCFVIADVSGKGIPAALFMMKAKALLREAMDNGSGLVDAVCVTNHMLCDGNASMMFVTAWVGVLDYGTGRVEYVNAGHNLPLFRSHDGSLEWLLCNPDPPLGILDGFGFSSHALTCQPGDQILLYTDGVTEAMDTNNELFGDDRLMDVVRDNCTLRPQQLVETVRASVADYANDAEQSDDITMLALEVCDA